jgi:hypothetical protein
MKFDPEFCSLMVHSESALLQDRIEEISRSTRATLAQAAKKVRQEIANRHKERDDTLLQVAEMLEHLAYGEA